VSKKLKVVYPFYHIRPKTPLIDLSKKSSRLSCLKESSRSQRNKDREMLNDFIPNLILQDHRRKKVCKKNLKDNENGVFQKGVSENISFLKKVMSTFQFRPRALHCYSYKIIHFCILTLKDKGYSVRMFFYKIIFKNKLN